jgi:hypothetical protein
MFIITDEYQFVCLRGPMTYATVISLLLLTKFTISNYSNSIVQFFVNRRKRGFKMRDVNSLTHIKNTSEFNILDSTALLHQFQSTYLLKFLDKFAYSSLRNLSNEN